METRDNATRPNKEERDSAASRDALGLAKSEPTVKSRTWSTATPQGSGNDERTSDKQKRFLTYRKRRATKICKHVYLVSAAIAFILILTRFSAEKAFTQSLMRLYAIQAVLAS